MSRFPNKPEKQTVIGLFEDLCITLSKAQRLPRRAAGTSAVAASLVSLESAAVALVPAVLKAIDTEDKSAPALEAALFHAGMTGCPAVVEAFPEAAPASVRCNTFRLELNQISPSMSAAHLRALYTRGYDLGALHHALVLRALRKGEADLQEFLLEVRPKLFHNFYWLTKLSRSDCGRGGEFLSDYLRATVPLYEHEASKMIGASLRSLDGLAFLLLKCAGAKIAHGEMIPDHAREVLSRLSNHKMLTLVPAGTDIARFWQDPVRISEAKALFMP